MPRSLATPHFQDEKTVVGQMITQTVEKLSGSILVVESRQHQDHIQISRPVGLARTVRETWPQVPDASLCDELRVLIDPDFTRVAPRSSASRQKNPSLQPKSRKALPRKVLSAT